MNQATLSTILVGYPDKIKNNFRQTSPTQVRGLVRPPQSQGQNMQDSTQS